jgi:hypothetical protein
MKKDEPAVQALSDVEQAPLMVFRELLRLSFEDLFVVESGKEEKVPREVLGLLDATFNMELSDMMSARSTEITRDNILNNGVVHRHLQDLTTLVLFQLGSTGPRHMPYDLLEVVKNFVLIFQPSGKDLEPLTMLNADNRATVSYHRDEMTMGKMLVANPWMLVLWVMRFDKAHYDQYSVLEAT